MFRSFVVGLCSFIFHSILYLSLSSYLALRLMILSHAGPWNIMRGVPWATCVLLSILSPNIHARCLATFPSFLPSSTL
ncbi:hypothetical protein DFH06DRAFT_1482824 [Mycena polygramma]|nr:hypothetical protein DFH06DRAFT_1482824 [Mycena polygramma]